MGQQRKKSAPQIKLAGMVTLYHPNDKDIANISTYLDDVDHLYVIDNTEERSNEKRLPDNPKIEYIWGRENIGVASALNLAAKKAQKAGFNWLLTNDQDTTFPPQVLKKLKKHAAKVDPQKIAIVTPWHHTKLRDEKPQTDDDPHDVMTSGNLLNLDIWQKIGGFKEELFIDGVDIEYCINLHKQGYHILRVNSLEIDHNLGDLFYRTFAGRLYLCTNHPAIRRYYLMRNYHYIYDLYSDYDFDYCNALAASQKHNMIGVLLFEKQKIAKIRMYLKGYRDYRRHIMGKYQG